MKLCYVILSSLFFGESCSITSASNTSGSSTATTMSSRMKSIISRPHVHRMHQLHHDVIDDLLQRTESDSLLDSQDVENLVKKPTSVSVIPRGGSITLQERLKIGFYFALWYALNIIYNIINKKLLNILPAPVTIGTIQLGIGGAYAALLWLLRLRATPQLTAKGKEICWKVGLYHGSGQIFSMVSLGAGPVSFTHIVKALEPFFSAMVSGVVFGKWMKPQVYATLLPVVGGVGYACLKERSFSWLAFWMAMLSNLSFALRAVVSKIGMTSHIGENITSVNLFALVTIASFILCIPGALITERGLLMDLWSKATSGATAVASSDDLIKTLIISGLFHYLNNEVMYLALSNVHPVTLAVGNTMKRVFIMVASVLVFRNPVSLQAGIGSSIGISGVLLYSLVKQRFEAIEAAEAASMNKKNKGRMGRLGRKN